MGIQRTQCLLQPEAIWAPFQVSILDVSLLLSSSNLIGYYTTGNTAGLPANIQSEQGFGSYGRAAGAFSNYGVGTDFGSGV